MRELEVRQRAYACAVAGNVCEVCGEPITVISGQMSHRIGDTLQNRKKFGDFVVDHILNVGMTCSLGCNAKLDISKNPGACMELCHRIYEYEIAKRWG